MDLNVIYKYAYWGAIEELRTLTKLHSLCIEAGDGDTAEEYEIQIEKVKSDFNFIIECLGYDKESCWQVLDYEIRKVR